MGIHALVGLVCAGQSVQHPAGDRPSHAICLQQSLDTQDPQGENMDVPPKGISGRDEHGRSVHAGRLGGNGHDRLSRAARLSQFMLLAIGVCFCSNLALWAQATESQTDSINSTLTVESHTQSDNSISDKQSVQHRGSDGHFEPYQDIEKKTVQVDATTVRTTTRTFDRDADGARILVEVIEEEKRTLPGGESNLVRTTSDPDVNGNLQPVRRQIEETKQTSANVEETKTTVMLPGADGGLVPAAKVQERRERGANDTVATQKTTLLPDGNGNWQVGEIRHTTTKQEGNNRSTEERISLPDSEGKLGEVSRTVTNESEGAPGEIRDAVETYSVAVPGAVGDGSLHLVGRATSVQHTSSSGQQITSQQVEQAPPGDPGSGLQVMILTTDIMRTDPSGAQSTRTVRARNANGSYDSYGVVTVDTTKSDKIPAIQVQIAPDKPK
jgi:hypothetical protein